MRAGLFAVALLAVTGTPVIAQDAETLADIRQDMAVMNTQLARLKQELNTTGAPGFATGGDTLSRVNAIEAELQRVTAKTEELEHRIDVVVSDGTKRLGDLNFRVCDLDPKCDIGSLGSVPVLGGESESAITPAQQSPAMPAAPAAEGAMDALASVKGELAVSEETDFRAAQDALNTGDFANASKLFSVFRDTYPGGPLEAAAIVGEGRALQGQGDTREGARRYLDAYSRYPADQIAPEALWRLGVSLADLGSKPEACVTLAELPARYPTSNFVSRANDSMAELRCQ